MKRYEVRLVYEGGPLPVLDESRDVMFERSGEETASVADAVWEVPSDVDGSWRVTGIKAVGPNGVSQMGSLDFMMALGPGAALKFPAGGTTLPVCDERVGARQALGPGAALKFPAGGTTLPVCDERVG